MATGETIPGACGGGPCSSTRYVRPARGSINSSRLCSDRRSVVPIQRVADRSWSGTATHQHQGLAPDRARRRRSSLAASATSCRSCPLSSKSRQHPPCRWWPRGKNRLPSANRALRPCLAPRKPHRRGPRRPFRVPNQRRSPLSRSPSRARPPVHGVRAQWRHPRPGHPARPSRPLPSHHLPSLPPPSSPRMLLRSRRARASCRPAPGRCHPCVELRRRRRSHRK
jgi:hypothetical protein